MGYALAFILGAFATSIVYHVGIEIYTSRIVDNNIRHAEALDRASSRLKGVSLLLKEHSINLDFDCISKPMETVVEYLKEAE